MRISTKGKYGLQAIVNLAGHTKTPVLLKVIAKEENLSIIYLETIFNLLKKAKIVDSVRGPNGGYKLTKSPEDTSVFEIIVALEGSLYPIDTRDIKKVELQTFWDNFHKEIEKYLQGITLNDFINTPNEYYI